MPTESTLATGTRSVILSFSKQMTNSSSLMAGDFLLFDGGDAADAVRRIDDVFARS